MVDNIPGPSAISSAGPDQLGKAGIRATAWIGLQSVTVNFASLIVFTVLGRILGPKDFGLVAAASVVVLFLRILVDGGISRKLIQIDTLRPEMVDTAFWAAVASGAALTLLTVAAAPLIADLFGQPRLTNVVRALSVILLLASFDRTQSALLDRRLAFRTQAIRSALAALCSSILAILAAIAGWGVWALVLQSVSYEVVTIACLWILSGWRPHFTFALKDLGELLSFGGRYMGFGITQYLILNADNFLIGVFLGPIALGYYVVSYRVLIVGNEALVMTVNRVGLATFSRLQTDQPQLERAIYGVASLSAAVALPIYAGLALLAPELIHLLFGPHWAASTPVMQVLCVAGAAQAITAFTHPLIIALGRVRDELRWNLGASGLLVLGFAASVHFGILAVAWSLAVGMTLLVPLRIRFIRPWTGTSLSSYFARSLGPAAATIVMIGGLLLLRQGLPTQHPILSVASQIAAGTLCYLASLTVLDNKTARALWHVARNIYR
jgi:O-antigen/teichoic acid export membrane protein